MVVVGGGPTGLWLAGELRLGGASVTVLEARAARDPHSKGLTVHPRTIEIFDSRGIAEPFLDSGFRMPSGHFAMLPDRLDYAGLDTPYPFVLIVPQARTERILEERAVALGAVVRRGSRVTALTPDGVTLDDGSAVTASWVVGCDGSHSTVRQAAGIAFEGTGSDYWGWLADVVLDHPPPAGAVTVANAAGILMIVPLGAGRHRVIGLGPEGVSAGAAHPGLAGMNAAVARVAGRDLGLRDPTWVSGTGNAARLAAGYRCGRVLVAGDAAHIHFPAGGVGMNTGLHDAHNLGWKLAAVATGRSPVSLLDTYEAERRPEGVRVLEHTRAQTALIRGYDPEGQALRALVSRLIAGTPELRHALAMTLSGLDVAYACGPRVRDQVLPDGRRLFEHLRGGGFVKTPSVTVRPDGHPAA